VKKSKRNCPRCGEDLEDVKKWLKCPKCGYWLHCKIKYKTGQIKKIIAHLFKET